MKGGSIVESINTLPDLKSYNINNADLPVGYDEPVEMLYFLSDSREIEEFLVPLAKEYNIEIEEAINFNEYKFKNCEEYKTFISEICKNLNLTNNTTILDICCGNGSFIQELIKMKNITNINMYGIDISEINIKYACEKYTGNYIVGDIKKPLPYDNNLFDYVIIISSLQYLENDEQLFFLLSEITILFNSLFIILSEGVLNFSEILFISAHSLSSVNL